jgi:hypothetical protein
VQVHQAVDDDVAQIRRMATARRHLDGWIAIAKQVVLRRGSSMRRRRPIVDRETCSEESLFVRRTSSTDPVDADVHPSQVAVVDEVLDGVPSDAQLAELAERDDAKLLGREPCDCSVVHRISNFRAR